MKRFSSAFSGDIGSCLTAIDESGIVAVAGAGRMAAGVKAGKREQAGVWVVRYDGVSDWKAAPFLEPTTGACESPSSASAPKSRVPIYKIKSVQNIMLSHVINI